MSRVFVSIIFLVGVVSFSFGQKGKHQLKVVFYNVENLFDTIDDKHKNDNEFLPRSEKEWNSERYQCKVTNLGKVLVAIDSLELPAVIGFAEVENREVLEDLIRLTPLQQAPYQIILEEGNDPRGIDVAMIYRIDRFTYISHRAIPASQAFRTRFILYTKLLGPAGDTLHIFVNHWKSRSGGSEKTLPKRIENATLLREVVDSLLGTPNGPRILIMGDLNDEPADESIALTLEALPVVRKTAEQELYNLFYSAWEEGKGTLWYRDWDLFDQIIVSGNLLSSKRKNRPVIRYPYGYIFRQEWMLDRSGGNEGIPFRTYKRDYQGGFSDHLPVFVILDY
ncbi:MAG: endonuclease/exonuclease/phosphatase family protein [Bacteroidota bacterium]